MWEINSWTDPATGVSNSMLTIICTPINKMEYHGTLNWANNPFQKTGCHKDEQTCFWNMFYIGCNPIQTRRRRTRQLSLPGPERTKSSKNGRGDQIQIEKWNGFVSTRIPGISRAILLHENTIRDQLELISAKGPLTHHPLGRLGCEAFFACCDHNNISIRHHRSNVNYQKWLRPVFARRHRGWYLIVKHVRNHQG